MSTGVYALKLDVDVWFRDEYNGANGGLELFDPSRGKISIYLRGKVTEVCEDGSGKVVVHPCGTTLPPIYADVAAGVVQITFPDALWDAPMIPDYNTTLTTGFAPGDTLALAKAAGLVGISLTAEDATWPTPAQTAMITCKDGKSKADCFPDMDGDGKPGITVKMKTDGTPPPPPYTSGAGPWKYTPAPTQPSDALGGGMVGATDVYIGLRTRLGGGGTIGPDCKSGSGGADVDDFESRVWDCTMKDGSKCTTDGASFVDSITPTFHVLKKDAVPPPQWKFPGIRAAELDPKLDRSPSKGPISSVVRLGDLSQNFTCADVRNAAYPAAN